MMNEFFVVCGMYHMILFTPFTEDASTKYYAGYSFVILVITMIAINVLLMIIGALRTIVNRHKLRNEKRSK
jgi:hypothetical protein